MFDKNIPRRRFLKTAAGAAGAVLALPITARGSSFPADAPSAIKLGVASYSFREFPRAAAIEMTRQLDTRYINIKSFHIPYELSPAETRAASHEFVAAGLEIVGGGLISFAEDSDTEVRKYFEYARNAGLPLMVVTGPVEIWPRVERFVKQYDIKIAIHNHGPEDERYPTPYEALARVQDLDPRMGLCIDVGHTARTGTDVVKAIADAGPRLLDMHLKDLQSTEPHAQGAHVGKGVLPFPAIFQQLLAMNYQGHANLEYEVEGEAKNPMPGMRESFAYMRGVLSGLAAGGPG